MRVDSPAPQPQQASGRRNDAALEAIADALQALRYGQVTITVQDGRVVQIERLDRRRMKT
jgi:hypothetical protein